VKRLPFVLAATLVVAGCGSAPPVEIPDATPSIPEEWTAADSASAPVAWWDSFEDERLETLVREALLQNPDMVAAAARLDAAAALARIAGADIWPQVSAGGRAARQQQASFIFSPPRDFRSTSYGVSLDVAWEIDLWGRLRNQKSAAAADLQAAAAEYHGARLSLAGQTIKAWFAVVESTRQVELAEETVASYRRTAANVRSRYEAGVRPALDLRLTLVDRANAESFLLLRKQLLDRARRQLEVLIGRYPAGIVAVDGELSPPPRDIPAGLPADLLVRRPDLVAAERRLAAANRRTSASRRALLPRLSLTAAGGATSEELGNLLQGDFTVWSLVGNLVQPLFQGGRLRAQVDLSEAIEDQALAAWASTVLVACAEVEIALEAERSLAAQETVLTEAAAQARAAHELAESRYQSGLDDVITLLAAQRSAVTAETRLLEVRRLRLDGRVDLHLALGGGLEPENEENES
jgi:NodT family efflux transporter outer membrane factor (OMF) lipoprotein